MEVYLRVQELELLVRVKKLVQLVDEDVKKTYNDHREQKAKQNETVEKQFMELQKEKQK